LTSDHHQLVTSLRPSPILDRARGPRPRFALGRGPPCPHKKSARKQKQEIGETATRTRRATTAAARTGRGGSASPPPLGLGKSGRIAVSPATARKESHPPRSRSRSRSRSVRGDEETLTVPCGVWRGGGRSRWCRPSIDGVGFGIRKQQGSCSLQAGGPYAFCGFACPVARRRRRCLPSSPRPARMGRAGKRKPAYFKSRRIS
jgi:hypothetical protein